MNIMYSAVEWILGQHPLIMLFFYSDSDFDDDDDDHDDAFYAEIISFDISNEVIVKNALAWYWYFYLRRSLSFGFQRVPCSC